MAQENFDLKTGAKGYNTKKDPTNQDEIVLVAGSQNVIINDQERVETRAGYEIFGAVDATANAPKSEFRWKNSSGGEFMLREINGELQYFSAISEAWEQLLTGLSTTKPVRFAKVFDGSTQLIDLMLFVNNSAILYDWGGGEGTLASVATGPNTITIDETIADTRFFISGTPGSIRVKDTGGTWREFTVSSHTGSVFSVTSDPTAFTFAAGAVVTQVVRQNANTPAANFTNDVIEVFQNQVFVGSEVDQRLFISKNTDFTDYTKSSPRIAGEGDTITLDASCLGLIVPGLKDSDTESKIIAFCRGDRAYKITFEISPGSTADREVPRVKALPIAEGQGALSQELIGKVGQTIAWVTSDQQLIDLGSIESGSINFVPLSDPIKPDFTAADFTNGQLKFWRSFITITAPPDSKMFVFDVSKKFWNSPMVIGQKLLTVYKGDLYGHSNAVSETYKLFTGLSDNGNRISFKAYYAYQNADKRENLKNFNRFFTEIYLRANTVATASILQEWQGAKGIQSYEVNGADDEFLFTPVDDASLGVNPLGTHPLGGLQDAPNDIPKYRRIKPLVPKDYFEYQFRFESDEADIAWQILTWGGNVKLSKNNPQTITK